MRKYSAIRNIMIFSKNCEKSAQFYVDVLGLKVNQMSPEYSELLDENNVKLVIKYSNRLEDLLYLVRLTQEQGILP